MRVGGSEHDGRGRVAAAVATSFILSCSPLDASAAFGDCGQPVSNGSQPSTTDALYVLRTGVGQTTCLPCVCDVNDSGEILVSDALVTLNVAVGLPVMLACPPCDSTTTTSTTTSTTLAGCPAANGLDGALFNEKYSCEETSGGPKYCSDLDSTIQLQFTLQGGGGTTYEVKHVPDDGVVKTGTLDCTTFTWIALAPDQYEETGVFEFSPNLNAFTGSSEYVALDESYEGECNINGAKAPTPAPDPLAPPTCVQ